MRIDISDIPSSNGKKESLKRNGDTMDIVKHILKVDRENDKRFCAFASQFERNKEGLRSLFYFVKNKIHYREDPDGFQYIKTPAALWDMGVGDCKSKTLFITQCLRCMGIPYIIRFVSYSPDSRDVTHVYPIAVLDGKNIIMDTVYGYFDSEKRPYYYPQDYPNMTHIMKISGVGQTFSTDICKTLTEIKQKQSYIPQQEFIPFSKLSAGFARALVFRRQLLIRKAMVPQQSKFYDAALQLLDSQLKRDFHVSKCISGVGSIAPELQFIAQKIAHLKTLAYPAMRLERPKPLRPAGAAIKGWEQNNTQYRTTDGKVYKFNTDPYSDNNCKLTFLETPAVQFLFKNDADKTYVYARNSQYKKKWDSPAKDAQGNTSTFGKEVLKLLQKYRTTPFMDGSNVIKMCHDIQIPILGPGGSVTMQQQQVCSPPLTPIANFLKFPYYVPNNVVTPATYAGFIDNPNNTSLFFADHIIFAHPDYRSQFMNELRLVSGIMDEYMNDTFQESEGIGNGFIYGYATDAKAQFGGPNLTLDDYPASVIAKYGIHAGYMNGAANFSGMDYDLLKDLGANTVRYHNNGGLGPDQILGELVRQKRKIAVGVIDPVSIIGAITALITAIVGAVAGFMGVVKQRAESMEPGEVPDDFKPIGESLQLSESDWAGGGKKEGGEEAGGGGMDMGKLLMAGGAAWLGWELLKNK